MRELSVIRVQLGRVVDHLDDLNRFLPLTSVDRRVQRLHRFPGDEKDLKETNPAKAPPTLGIFYPKQKLQDQKKFFFFSRAIFPVIRTLK